MLKIKGLLKPLPSAIVGLVKDLIKKVIGNKLSEFSKPYSHVKSSDKEIYDILLRELDRENNTLEWLKNHQKDLIFLWTGITSLVFKI